MYILKTNNISEVWTVKQRPISNKFITTIYYYL